MNPFSSSSSSSSSSPSSSLIMRKRGSTCSDDETEQPNCKRLNSLKNDVFINYSFEEIGNGFISHLKGSLTRHGFFISDHKDLQVGQDVCCEVLKAIEESEIYVVVFSPGYASSLRSLDELVDIMKCRGERIVYPVFYKVEPTEVRNQQGSFKKVFQDYEADGEVDPERVRKWKQDLKDVCELAGSTLKNDRDEGTFVSEIVEKLWEMQKSQDLHVTDYPVGIRSRVEELVSLLRLDCDGVLVSSVSGFSGIGKTTIVKAMYNEIASKFNASCFLEDIHRRYNGRGDGKLKLQKELISQITNDGKVKLRCDGVEKIKKLLGCRKTLLVLDDVQKFEQLEGLGINSLRFFYKGSRIIVTTRDVDSLGGIPHTSYHTRLLNERESRKLFIRLMFARDEPVHTKFVEEVVARARGLPLVLKVWSRHFTQYKEHLPAALKTLKQIPHDDVQKQLQMSYDSLSVESKNLFLDIACFFDGMDKDLVFKVLNDEDSCVDYEIEKLAHKFLVENKEYVVSLPYVIKNMGHEVVRQEHPGDPGQRTRLMDSRDVVRVIREYKGTDSVRSIQLDLSQMEERETLQLEAFKKMSSLRFIKIYESDAYKMITFQWSSTNDDMSACFSFKRLKYLEWVGFPCKSLDNIDMGNVVVIILHKSKLEKLWEGVKNFKKLKVLDVSYSRSLTKTGNFIGLENIEELCLRECSNLEELDSSISCLHQLTSLTLSGCTNLKSIRANELQFLTKLATLRNLQVLYMENCNISQVSSGIGNLVSLRLLRLSRNTFSSLPESFSNLSQLKYLFINDCSELQLLPPLPSQLTDIIAANCGSLDLMPFDSMQNAYIFPSKFFKESRLMSNEGLRIDLSGKELPEWCTYRDSGNVISFVAPIQFDHSKICGLILCATRDNKYAPTIYPVIYNKTKGTSHRFSDFAGVWGSMLVMFYPLNNTTIVVEAGDTLEVELNDESLTSGGLRLVYENDVVDSGYISFKRC